MNTMEKWSRASAMSATGGPALFSDILYDRLAYPAAGVAGALQFFGVPIGQGATLFGAGAKTYADTNLELASQLSTGEAFRGDYLSFSFQSGVHAVSNVVTAAAPAAANNLAAQDEQTFWYTSGAFFELKVLSKVWARGLVQDAPPAVRMSLQSSAALAYTLAAAASATDTITGGVIVPVGKLWELMDPGLRLDATVKFSLTLRWNALAAMPSGIAGIVSARLIGDRMERSQ